jgi:siroheme synthase-like protein
MSEYPIVLNLKSRRVIVVGLGNVGRRKAAGLVEAGAEVVAIDPIGEGGRPVSGVLVVAEPYRCEHLDGAILAFASASPQVNRRVVEDARRLGVLVNSASESGSGDFSIPAVWRDGPILLALSTSGAGPALASTVRDRAAQAIGPSASGLASLLAELRPEVLARVPDERIRRMLFRAWSDPGWLDLWQAKGPDVVRTALIATLNDALTKLPPGANDFQGDLNR